MAAKNKNTTLTKEHRTQLLQWIGRATGKFELIYSAKRDGGQLNAATFHQKCNGRSPTVTVATNNAGYIFGGYTAMPWHQNGNYSNDPAAFLFRLNEANVYSPKKSNCCTTVNGILGNGQYGPTFGGGNDWYPFSGTIGSSGTYWQGNGAFKLGHSYAGLTTQEFSGNNQCYTDFEVYEILDVKIEETPWRKGISWQNKDRDILIKSIQHYRPVEEMNLRHANILLIGQIGSGKSSFYNTLQSIFKGYVVNKAISGSGAHSITTKFRKYDIRSENGPLSIKLCDTMGLEEEGGLNVIDFPYILDGNIPDRFQFNPAARVTPRVGGFIKDPTLATMIHCVTFVIDVNTVSMMSEKMMAKLKAIQELVNERGIPLLVLMTKIDQVCGDVEQDTSVALRSTSVHDMVKLVSDKFGVPSSSVLPVRNYESQIELDVSADILSLVALRQILRAADGYFEEQADLLAEENISCMNIKPDK
ncbi:unnamed protein product [Owenia fusiformis]|uniref:TLDc domain-containing protein n=1 Tax=Owenia fusiformis TaxID=6347 RepID=A0A8S4PGP7_OWEFU|nr:unnamed protein product [Owenia fusiformis]